ncbi:DoxX family protein [Arcticibacter tournemirensis]|uniref:DoxX family protein n=1 Tax=Arcticibacter tournemirensis TaxID=699437 RepID=A0A4Q0MCQ1_9SPHI|nr:DoxX family protein [Arcticibacter tournemirensis]RXF71148.1 DoxX family protein [Arcticibacter tournemirensis]
MLKRIIKTPPQTTTIIIRLMVGAVFLSEGIQKFLYPDKLGAGRFEKIGFPEPEFLGYLVGSFEIGCGLLVLLGFLTRLATIPLLAIMLVAIATTKAKLIAEDGLWLMLHESRTDWSMLLGSVFLLITGGGKWSIDRSIWKKQQNNET